MSIEIQVTTYGRVSSSGKLQKLKLNYEYGNLAANCRGLEPYGVTKAKAQLGVLKGFENHQHIGKVKRVTKAKAQLGVLK